jgi:hypothetical protein
VAACLNRVAAFGFRSGLKRAELALTKTFLLSL